jgi:tetratricopeptide (TPR) repeat protein
MYFSSEWFDQHIATIPDKKIRQVKTIMFLTSASDFMFDESIHLAKEIYKEGIENDDKGLAAFGLMYDGFYHRAHGQNEQAAEAHKEAEALMYQAQTGFAAGVVGHMLAFEYWAAGMRDKAFEMSYYALKSTAPKDSEGIGWAEFQLGVFHYDLKDYETSLHHFSIAEARAQQLGHNYQLARTRSGIGSIYISTDRLEEGLQYNILALEGYRTCGHKTAMSRALNDLGIINFRLGKVDEAEKYLREALAVREALAYSPGIITTRMELAKVLLTIDKLPETESLLISALTLSEKTNSKQKMAQCHLLLAELYKLLEKPWQALEHLEAHFKVNSVVAGEEATNRVNSMQQKFATEKSESEAEIHRLKNVELKKAYSEIEEKNKSILDSIHYAKRIQGALLASDELL